MGRTKSGDLSVRGNIGREVIEKDKGERRKRGDLRERRKGEDEK
jgi:hypothetical protein